MIANYNIMRDDLAEVKSALKLEIEVPVKLIEFN